MDESMTCPMAFFTPIVEIAEEPTTNSTKEKSSKSKLRKGGSSELKIGESCAKPNTRSRKTASEPQLVSAIADNVKNQGDINKEQELEKPATDSQETKEIEQTDEPKNETKKQEFRGSKRKRGRPKKIVLEPKKSKRKYTKKSSPVVEEPKKEKKPRKQRSPKKKPPDSEVMAFKFDDDVFISPEHLDVSKVIKCPICKDEKEWNAKDIKEHYKLLHPGKRLRTSRFFGDVHPCDVCGKEFKSPGSLKDHIETHNSYYYCDICNHSTKKIVDHIVHMRVHNINSNFQCLMCDFRTKDINEITEHATNHEDLLKYWCASCKKSFSILQHFQEHDNYHTGLKPFDCLYCDKSFLYSRYLHAHKITMHKDLMSCPSSYVCVICAKVYQHRNSLKLHMNSHTGNFAVCDICGKTLSSKEKLKFHLRTHTGYKPYR
ncbi:hypothetical protein YQE_06781, partial [Dendroctonus ponderosae]